MPVFNNPLAGAAGSGGAAAYEIERSLRFNTNDTSFLEKTFSSAGIRKKWTWSGWVKKCDIDDSQIVLFSAYGGTGNAYLSLDFRHDQPRFLNWNGTSIVDEVKASAKLRDPSAWYHIIWAVDTDQSTDADKVKLYINGVRQTQFETANYPSTGDSLYINNKIVHEIGRNVGTSSAGFNGYLAEVHFVDGQQLDETSFGEFDADTGVWNPIEYTHSDIVDYSGNNQITIDPGNYYLNNLDGPNAFNGDGFTYIDARLGTGSNSTSNIIWQPTGGIENVTKIRVHTNYATHYRINNGTWTSFSSAGTYAEIYSGTAFTLTKLEIRRDNCQASDWGHRVTFYEINDVEYQNLGLNSFNLDFSDNSSNAALGYDAAGSNNWTVNNINATAPLNSGPFSAANAYTGTTENSYGISDGTWNSAFDGSINNGVYVAGASGETILTMVNSASWSSQIRIRREYRLGEVDGWVKLNNTEISGGTSSSQWIDVTSDMGSSGTLTSVGVRNYARLFAIELDGEILTDSANPARIDSLIDSPTNYEAASGNNGGNYCVLNPLASTGTLSDGNLTGATGATTNYGTFAIPSSGSWYWECTIGGQNHNLGIAKHVPNAAQVYLINDSCLYSAAGVKNVDGVTDVSFGGSSSPGDVIGVLANADTDTVTFYRNGSSIGSISHGVAGRFPVFGDGNVSEPASPVNFGQRPFAISSLPTGAKSLCTQNLDPAITKPSEHFDVKTWSGNGSSQTISGLDFSPDVTLIKARAGNAFHTFFSTVRGPAKRLSISSSGGGESDYGDKGVTAFGTNSFTVTDNSNGDYNVNGSNGGTYSGSGEYVGYVWDAGSTFSNSAGSNGATIASSGRANTTAGISVVEYTGTGSSGTVFHGLNAAPGFIILKGLNTTEKWKVLHEGAESGSNAYYQNVIHLNTSENLTGTGNNYPWGGTAPTSSVFSVDNVGTEGNRSGSISSTNYLAYCFSPVDQFSKFGRYTGTSGQNFVWCGFQPKWLMIKNLTNSNYPLYTHWAIFDTERQTFNVNVNALWANVTNHEGTRGNNTTASAPDFGLDILSNGFCLRDTGASEINLNGDTYIFMAFAEHPFATARAR